MSARKSLIRFFVGLAVVGASAVVVASTNSPIQSNISPYFGKQLVGNVQTAASDSQSQAFQSSYEPTFLAYVKSKLPEGVAFTGVGVNQLDPQRLYFISAYAPRVYFLYEETGAVDQIGCTIGAATTPTTGATVGTTYTLFPNGSLCTDPLYSSNTGIRSLTYPLLNGDFVQLPTVQAGQQLAFCMANLGMKGIEGGNVGTSGVPSAAYSGGPAAVAYNGVSPIDDFQHMIAFFPDTTSQYIIIGLEDWWFGDKDCNDQVIVVDVGLTNANAWRSGSVMPK